MAKNENEMLAQLLGFAEDMHKIGAYSDEGLAKARKITARSNPMKFTPLVSFGAEEVRALRESFAVSQAVFAALLNVQTTTVQKWEAGQNKPSGPSLKLLTLAKRKGLKSVA